MRKNLDTTFWPSAKTFVPAQKRRQPEGRLGALSEPFAGSENIQIESTFTKPLFSLEKGAALSPWEKEPPAILVGFPYALAKAVKVTRKFQIEDNMPVYGRPSGKMQAKDSGMGHFTLFYRVV